MPRPLESVTTSSLLLHVPTTHPPTPSTCFPAFSSSPRRSCSFTILPPLPSSSLGSRLPPPPLFELSLSFVLSPFLLFRFHHPSLPPYLLPIASITVFSRYYPFATFFPSSPHLLRSCSHSPFVSSNQHPFIPLLFLFSSLLFSPSPQPLFSSLFFSFLCIHTHTHSFSFPLPVLTESHFHLSFAFPSLSGFTSSPHCLCTYLYSLSSYCLFIDSLLHSPSSLSASSPYCLFGLTTSLFIHYSILLICFLSYSFLLFLYFCPPSTVIVFLLFSLSYFFFYFLNFLLLTLTPLHLSHLYLLPFILFPVPPYLLFSSLPLSLFSPRASVFCFLPSA